LFTAAALVGKGGAALLAGRVSGFDRHEIGVAFSLSAAQAAATLAATIVGFEVGLFDEETVHAVLIVILVTVVLASWVGQRVMPRLAGAPSVSDLGERVLVPVANPAHAATHVEFAAKVALPDRGIVMPLHVVVDPAGNPGALDGARSWLAALEGVGYRCGVEAHAQLRLDASIARGVGRSVSESDATLVIIGWSAHRPFAPLGSSGVVDEIVALSRVPVVVVMERGIPLERVILALTAADMTAAASPRVELAAAAADKLGRGTRSRVLLAPDDTVDLDAAVGRLGRWEMWFDQSPRLEALEALVRPGDLVVVPAGEVGPRALWHDLDELAVSLRDATVVLVFGPYAAPPTDTANLGIVRVDRSATSRDTRASSSAGPTSQSGRF